MDKVFSYKQTQEIKEFFHEYGYVTISDIFQKEEIESLKQAFTDAVENGNIKLDSEVLIECNDVIYRHPLYEKYAKDERTITLVEELFGRKGIELQHSKINSKPMEDKGKGIIHWHQDYPFFPHTNFDMVAFGIHLDDEEMDSGPLMVVPKSHALGVLSHCEDEKFIYQCSDKEKIKKVNPIPICCKAGYVTIHHCLTLHYSGQKTNTKNRRLLVYQYRTLDNIQLAGVIWKCTGLTIKEGDGKGYARFADGTKVEIRGKKGRLYDKFAKLAPDNIPTSY